MLHVGIDIQGLDQIVLDLGATEKQVKFALNRAAKRTASALRVMAARRIKDELALRTIALLRKRLSNLRLRKVQEDGAQLWFGLNDMPVSWFKGTPRQSSTGASFRGQEFKGAFVAKSTFKGRNTIFKREGSARLPITEQNAKVSDKMQVIVEDEIFDQAEKIFWKNFQRDLRARVKYKLGEA